MDYVFFSWFAPSRCQNIFQPGISFSALLRLFLVKRVASALHHGSVHTTNGTNPTTCCPEKCPGTHMKLVAAWLPQRQQTQGSVVRMVNSALEMIRFMIEALLLFGSCSARASLDDRVMGIENSCR